MNKIKFLAVSDIHSDEKLIEKIKKNVDFNSIDFIIMTGDISDKSDDFYKILEPFKGKSVYMVPGNHESKNQVNKLKKFYNVKLIGNNPIKINENLWLFGTNYITMGEKSIDDDQLFTTLSRNILKIPEESMKIMACHEPAAGTKIGDSSPFIPASEGVAKFLDTFDSDLFLCGHIHESSGLEEIINDTWTVNVAQTYSIFEADPEKHEIKRI